MKRGPKSSPRLVLRWRQVVIMKHRTANLYCWDDPEYLDLAGIEA